jgi:hypothetical protein
LSLSLTPENQVIADRDLGAYVSLAVNCARMCGFTREQVTAIVGAAYDALVHEQVAAATEAGRTATTRRGPNRQKGRRS